VTFDLGDGVPLRYEARTPDGTLTSATVVLTITAPDGSTSTPTVTATSTGIYDATKVVSQNGTWKYVWTVTGAVTDTVTGTLDVADPAPPLYTDLPLLKLALAGKAAGSTTALAMDATRDELLVSALSAASRGIDDYCGRRFYPDLLVSARVFRPRGRLVCEPDGERLLVDDIASTSGLIVEVGSGSSYTAVTDVETAPDNAIARGEAITSLARTWWGLSGTTRVRVTARWGWPTTPRVVAQATLMQAARLYRRKDSPEGVLGNAEWGTVRVSRIDPDVQALISHLVAR
jgi:hypothetical protein